MASFEQCLDVIKYLHINDNNARVDAHLIPGYGTCEWEQLTPLIARLPQRTSAMLDIFPTRFQIASEISSGLRAQLTKWLHVDCEYKRELSS